MFRNIENRGVNEEGGKDVGYYGEENPPKIHTSKISYRLRNTCNCEYLDSPQFNASPYSEENF